MIRLQIVGVSVRIHALLPILLALSFQMGVGREALALLPALLLHETAHVAAARLCGMRVISLELTPLGAAARLGNPWNAGTLQVVLTALAGPAVNALALCAIASAAYAGWIGADLARMLIAPNVLLLAVNLIPALPMDGGRALCALLSGRIGVQRAVRFGVRAGCAVAALILAAAVYSGLTRGVWNIAMLASAAYIAACALRETDAAASASAEALVGRRDQLRRGALPVRMLAVPEDLPLSRAVGLVRPGRLHVFALYDDQMRPSGLLQERDLLASFPADAAAPLSDLIRKAAADRSTPPLC